MRVTLLKSKLHRASVTGADLHYEGSIAIGPELCEAAHLLQNERVEIYNVANGARFATYVIHGKKGEIMLNGAAARMVCVGDPVIIVSYADFEMAEAVRHQPRIVMVDGKNEVTQIRG